MRYLIAGFLVVFLALLRGSNGIIDVTTTAAPIVACSASCSGYSFVSGGLTFCWQTGDVVSYCNGSIFALWTNSPVPDAPCHGYIQFNVQGSSYWLNDTTFYKLVSGTWTSFGNSYKWYLGRLRPNEAAGWVYCSFTSVNYVSGWATTKPFYYNGTYYDLSTDINGIVQKSTQSFSQYSLPYFSAVSSETGCDKPICCWFQDTVGSSVAEILYNSSGFYIWSGSSYSLYTGEMNNIMSACLYYFANATFTYQLTETTYSMINGGIYALSSSGTPTGSSLNMDYATLYFYDPLATGGYYEYDSLLNIGLYYNESGVFWVNIVNGIIKYHRKPGSCEDDDMVSPAGISGNPYPICNYTMDTYQSFLYQICDPSATTNTCGDNMICQPAPSVYMVDNVCFKGLCAPDYSKVCPSAMASGAVTVAPPTAAAGTTAVVTTAGSTAVVTTGSTTTLAPLFSLKKFGSSCSFGSDCYTGICINSICGCANCTKLLPAIVYDPNFQIMSYAERCIPLATTIGGEGDPCDMWAKVPSRACGFGMTCYRCPETLGSSYATATCVAINLMSQKLSCPSWYKCGYLANCTMIGGVTPSCVCPAGYNLENNLKDCYGWKEDNYGECNVTCGNGFQTADRYCDRAYGSKTLCTGNVTSVVVPCIGRLGLCPINATMLPAAVYVGFPSKVMTVQLFQNMAKNVIKAGLISVLSTACTVTAELYQYQCCPGKIFPNHVVNYDCINTADGVTITNEYTDGSWFSFYVFAKGEPKSQCCRASANMTIARRKRSTVTTNFDQGALLPYLQSSAVLQTMNSVLQSIDPSIVITTTSISVYSTTTEESTTGHESHESAHSLTGIAAMSTAAFGAIAAIVALIVVGGVIGGLVYFHKRRARAKKLALLRKAGLPPVSAQHVEPEMLRKPMVPTGDPSRRSAMPSSAMPGGYNNGFNSSYPRADSNMGYKSAGYQEAINQPAYNEPNTGYNNAGYGGFNNDYNQAYNNAGYGQSHEQMMLQGGGQQDINARYPPAAGRPGYSDPNAAYGY